MGERELQIFYEASMLGDGTWDWWHWMSLKLHDLPEESLALAEDPGGHLVYPEQPEQPPLLRLARQERESFSPMLLSLGALVMLGIIIGMVLGTIENANTTAQQNAAAPSAPDFCSVAAMEDLNIRMGPGFDYPRAWILGLGEARVAVARTGDGWLQVANGWLLADKVRFTPPNACDGLEIPAQITLFDDDVVLPEAVIGLGWHELLEEGFVTPANNWTDATTSNRLLPQEGALILAAGMQAAPQDAKVLADAYYTLRGEWVVSEPGAALMMQFRVSDQGAYWVSLGIDGALQIGRDEVILAEGQPVALSPDNSFVIGVLSHGTKISVYVNNEPRLTAEDASLTSGTYNFHLRGNGAALRLERFELSTPLTDF